VSYFTNIQCRTEILGKDEKEKEELVTLFVVIFKLSFLVGMDALMLTLLRELQKVILSLGMY